MTFGRWCFRRAVGLLRTFAVTELTNIVGALKLQVSSAADQSAPLNIFALALNVCAGQSLHFSNSLPLFFSCSNADATTSALGLSRSTATHKRVDLLRAGVEPQF